MKMITVMLAVRDLIDLVFPPSPARGGSQAVHHAHLSAQKETRIRLTEIQEGFRLKIGGYIDAIQNGVVVEVKTGDPPEELDEAVAAQVDAYAYMYAVQNGLETVSTRIEYVTMDRTTIAREETATVEDLAHRWRSLIGRVMPILRSLYRWRRPLIGKIVDQIDRGLEESCAPEEWIPTPLRVRNANQAREIGRIVAEQSEVTIGDVASRLSCSRNTATEILNAAGVRIDRSRGPKSPGKLIPVQSSSNNLGPLFHCQTTANRQIEMPETIISTPKIEQSSHTTRREPLDHVRVKGLPEHISTEDSPWAQVATWIKEVWPQNRYWTRDVIALAEHLQGEDVTDLPVVVSGVKQFTLWLEVMKHKPDIAGSPLNFVRDPGGKRKYREFARLSASKLADLEAEVRGLPRKGEERDYCEVVELQIGRVLTAEEFTHVQAWFRAEVPLGMVLEAIDQFNHQRGRKPVLAMAHLGNIVSAVFQEWQVLNQGAGAEDSDDLFTRRKTELCIQLKKPGRRKPKHIEFLEDLADKVAKANDLEDLRILDSRMMTFFEGETSKEWLSTLEGDAQELIGEERFRRHAIMEGIREMHRLPCLAL